MTIEPRAAWRAAALALALAALAYDLGGYPLLDPDEGRNAEVMREMAATNDYVVPRLNGLPYVDKPVLYFAVGATLIELLGPTAVAARLPSLLFTLATIALVFWFARRRLGSAAAWTAAVAAAATPFTVAYARTVIFDSAVMFFVTAALVAFYEATEADESAGARFAAAVAAFIALAFGILTKGPVALAVPLMVALPYAWWRRRARALFDPVAGLLAVALVLPWVFAMSQSVPGYLRYILVTETGLRLTTDALGRWEPVWYFAVIFPAAALPWTVVAAAAAWRPRGLAARRHSGTGPWRPGGIDPLVVYLGLWIAVPLVFFSLSQSKRPQYVLPLVPAVALLVAALWRDVPRAVRGARAGAAALVTMGLFFVTGRHVIPTWVSTTGGVTSAIPPTALLLGLACAAGGGLAWLGARRRELALLGLALPVAAIPFVSRDLMDAIARERSAAELARAIEHVAGPAAQVIGVAAYPPSLSFYLRRAVLLATADGAELTSNYLERHLARWHAAPTVRPANWWREALLACDRPRVFVVRSDDTAARATLAAQLDLIAETRKYAAYGPCGLREYAAHGRRTTGSGPPGMREVGP